MGRVLSVFLFTFAACNCGQRDAPDAGPIEDAGTLVDAGDPDSGVPDAAVHDAGEADAGSLDAGTIDAGPDVVAPTFVISVSPSLRPVFPDLIWNQTIPSSEWRLDEDPVVAISWMDRDVDPVSVTLRVELEADGGGLGSGAGIARLPGCVADAGCQLFKIDGSRLPPESIHEPIRFVLRAEGSDFSGNGSASSNWLYVGRGLWQWGIGLPPTVPTLDPDGNIYVATSDGFASITAGGDTRWRWTDGGPGGQSLYVPAGDAGLIVFARESSLRAVRATDGVEDFSCQLPSGAQFRSIPVSVITTGRHAVAAAASLNGTGELLTLSFERTGARSFACATQSVTFEAAANATPVAWGETLCMPGSDQSVHCTQLTDAGTWAAFTSVDPPGTEILGMVFVEGKPWGTTAMGSIFGLNASRTAVDSIPLITDEFRSSHLIVGLDALNIPVALLPDRGLGGYWSVVQLDGGSPGVSAAPGTGEETTCLAAAEGAFYLPGYIERNSFRLDASQYFGDVAYFPHRYWLDNADIDIPATLDCNRLTGRGGVIYAVDRYRQLRAYVVPSPGLDPRAPWPKYQRDPANSGNGEVDLLPLYRCP